MNNFFSREQIVADPGFNRCRVPAASIAIHLCIGLVAEKTVTIAKLREIAPSGTIDPTATVYNSTMYLMAVLLGIALVANLLVRPVDSQDYLKE